MAVLRGSGVALGVAVALVGARATSVRADTAKTSLAVETAEAGWQRSGFRLALGLLYGELAGMRGAPSGRLLGPQIHAGLRLDRRWSLYATFEYVRAQTTGGLSGLRFAGTVDPTWHVTPHVAVAVGMGFGGIVEGRTGRADVMPYGSTLDTSYTFPDSKHPIPSCSGVGAAGLVRGTYSHVLGPKSAAIVELEIVGQQTQCVEATGMLEADTARPIERRQTWGHAGGTLLIGISWR